MTGSNDKDTLDSFFREAFEQMPETPSPSGWDAPPSNMWSKIQTDLNTTPTPPTARFGRMWYIGAASIVALLAFFLYFSNQQNEASIVAEPAVVESTQSTDNQAVVKETAIISEETLSENAKPVIEEVPAKNTIEKAITSSSTELSQKNIVTQEVKTPRIAIENTEMRETAPFAIPTTSVGPEILDKVQKHYNSKVEDVTRKEAEEAKPKAFPNTLERLKAEAAAKEKAKENPLWLDLLPKRPIPPVEL